MFWLQASISFERLKPITNPASVEIKRSWAELADTCTITLARTTQLRSGVKLNEAIRRGDAVEVKLGLNDRMQTEFVGFVSQAPKSEQGEFVVQCEDAMWQLKQTPAKVSMRNAKLRELVAEIVPAGTATEVINAEIGPFRADDTAGAILATLAEDYELISYFRQGTLVVGQRYPEDAPEVRYNFERNVAERDLEFVRAEDQQMQVKATSIQPSGQRISVTIPTGDGFDTRGFTFQGLSKSELEERAEAKLEAIRFNGYEGSMTTFGLPYVEHGWRANLRDPKFPEFDGAYLIDEVATKFGSNGFFRTLKLGPRV